MRQVELPTSTLHVRDEGAGRPLVFVHGFPLDHTMWASQITHFKEEYRVLAPDLAGFGRSSPVDATEYSMASYADDLSNLLDELQVTEPIVLCGLSMGGYIAWQFWSRHGERLAGLVLCDTRAQADSEEVANGRRYMAERVLEQGSTGVADEMLSKLFAPSTIDAESPIVHRTRDVMRSTRRETIAAAQRGMAVRPDMTSLLAQIELPTLLIGGEHDVISTPQEMRSIADQLPQSEFVEISSAGHMSPLEQPDQVNMAMHSFLRASGW